MYQSLMKYRWLSMILNLYYIGTKYVALATYQYDVKIKVSTVWIK